MNWKVLSGVLLIPYLVAVFAGAVLTLNSATDSATANDLTSYLNAAGNPSEIKVDQPTAGTNQSVINTTVSYPQTPVGWISFLARSVSMTGPVWEPWTAPIRLVIGTLTAPSLLMITVGLYQALSFFISGIGGLLSRI